MVYHRNYSGSMHICLRELRTCLYSGLLMSALIHVICDSEMTFSFRSSSRITLCGMMGHTFDEIMRFDLVIKGRISKLCDPMFIFVGGSVMRESAVSFLFKYMHTRPWEVRDTNLTFFYPTNLQTAKVYSWIVIPSIESKIIACSFVGN